MSKFYRFCKITKIKSIYVSNMFNMHKKFYNKFTNQTIIYFLVKNNIFAKSKYSRTRQWSKSIVYFGLWYGILSVFFLFFYLYKFVFIFSYLWWVIFLIIFLSNLKYLRKNIKYFYFNLFNFWK